MKLTVLEKLHLEAMRSVRNDDMVAAHHEVHALVCDNQDDGCTVSEEVALKILAVINRFALVRRDCDTAADPEFFALSLVDPDSNGSDFLYCAISVNPDENGRYAATSASDLSEDYLS